MIEHRITKLWYLKVLTYESALDMIDLAPKPCLALSIMAKIAHIGFGDPPGSLSVLEVLSL